MMNSMIQSGFKYLIANTVNKNLEMKFILKFLNYYMFSIVHYCKEIQFEIKVQVLF